MSGADYDGHKLLVEIARDNTNSPDREHASHLHREKREDREEATHQEDSNWKTQPYML